MFRKSTLTVMMMLALVLFVGQAFGADRVQDDRAPDDWSDSPFTPTANHVTDTYEWLGVLVDGEGGVNVTDDNAINLADDDGLLGVWFNPTNNVVGVTFLVTTTKTANPGAFPLGKLEYVDGWIDWNDNNTFEANERVDNGWHSDPNTWPGDTRIGMLLEVRAGATPGSHAVRLRLNWDQGPNPVGGALTYGEVEDYYDFSVETCEDCEEMPQVIIPTLTEYGMLVLVLLLVASAAWVIYRRRSQVTA